ncbi:hypothetical protein PAPHI01_0118 [Pancytospora philotis]|nr:hypothetical protein PAPHI01_0118 [Pancytospora philotis]
MFSQACTDYDGHKERARKRNLQAVLGLLKMKNDESNGDFRNLRTQKNEFQKSVLKEVFRLTRFPSKQTRDDLALLLNHTNRGIQIWFQNQRNNRESKEEDRHSSSPVESDRRAKDKHGTIDVLTLIDIIEKNIPGDKIYYWKNFIDHVPKYY